MEKECGGTDREWDGDALKLYLQQAGRTDLLTAEEERELANRISAGDQTAKEQLVCANLRLVISIAKKYARRGKTMTIEDLIQEGNCGLMKAADRFDPSKGYRFSTYATWWIRQSIIRALADQDRMVRLPVHRTEQLNQVKRAVVLSRQITGEDSLDYEQLSDMTGMDPDTVEKALQYSERTVSLDTPVGEDGTATIGHFIADTESPSPEKVVADRSVRKVIYEQLDTLKPREKKVLEMRFGLTDDRPCTLEEVGNYFGVTRERIRQIETKALRKLRAPSCRKRLAELL